MYTNAKDTALIAVPKTETVRYVKVAKYIKYSNKSRDSILYD